MKKETPKLATVAGYILSAIILIGLIGATGILVYKMLSFLISIL